MPAWWCQARKPEAAPAWRGTSEHESPPPPDGDAAGRSRWVRQRDRPLRRQRQKGHWVCADQLDTPNSIGSVLIVLGDRPSC